MYHSLAVSSARLTVCPAASSLFAKVVQVLLYVPPEYVLPVPNHQLHCKKEVLSIPILGESVPAKVIVFFSQVLAVSIV